MPPAVCIVIPTFNGAQRLPLVLDALAMQDAPRGLFEVVVVDNASTDDTLRIANHCSAAETLKARGIPYRCLSEPRAGATYARIAGLRNASSDLVCFLDDDNIPDFDYVKTGAEAFADPSVGLVISSVRPSWERMPPPAALRRQHLFAVNEYLGSNRVDFGGSPSISPTISAGMWVRRDAFLASVPCDQPERLLPDRIGNSLACSGDIEFGILIGRAGYRRIYVPELRLLHLIPARRLKVSYVCRLIVGIVRSEITLGKKYSGLNYSAFDQLKALSKLFAAVLASPAVTVSRADGVRESIFIVADRWARLAGPFRAPQ
jgi:glycosyltransferase involved in cell wall biosynthesis